MATFSQNAWGATSSGDDALVIPDQMSHFSAQEVRFALPLSCAFIVLHLECGKKHPVFTKDLWLFSSQRTVGLFIDKVH